MSSQSGPSIPLTFSTPQQAFRLIELPPELAKSLKSDNPPTLSLKSSTPAIVTPFAKSSNGSTPSQTSTAHLVTPTSSYQIRQVSTSNSVFITRPSRTSNLPQDGEENAAQAPNTTSTSLTAIAQVDSILELQPVSYSAEAELLKVLPVWISSDHSIPDALPRRSKHEIFSEIPVPDSQLESACIKLLVFVLHDENNTAAVPSPSAALDAWKSLLGIALDRSIDLASFFFPSSLLTPSSTSDTSSDPNVTNLQEAILHYLCTPLTSLSLSLPPPQKSSSPTAPQSPWNADEKTWLDKTKTVRWTGAVLLLSTFPHHDDDDDCMTGTSSSPTTITAQTFLSQWHNILPSEIPMWTNMATLESLSDLCSVTDAGTVKLTNTAATIASAADTDRLLSSSATAAGVSSRKAAGPTAAAATDKKRKWHEKFKAQRDAAAAAKKR